MLSVETIDEQGNYNIVSITTIGMGESTGVNSGWNGEAIVFNNSTLTRNTAILPLSPLE